MTKQARLKQLAELDAWPTRLSPTFPGPMSGAKYWHEKIPVRRSLVRSGASVRTKGRCAQALVNVAAQLARIKPSAAASARVTAVVSLPDMFDSEVCIFFDEAYFDAFKSRDGLPTHDRQVDHWARLPPERSIVRELNLVLPDKFKEIGFSTHWEDHTFNPPWVENGEAWIVGEVDQP
jgi:hypothetical protein